MSSDCEPSIIEALRIHAETLGAAGKPASRQLLLDAAAEMQRLNAEVERLRADNAKLLARIAELCERDITSGQADNIELI